MPGSERVRPSQATTCSKGANAGHGGDYDHHGGAGHQFPRDGRTAAERLIVRMRRQHDARPCRRLRRHVFGYRQQQWAPNDGEPFAERGIRLAPQWVSQCNR